MNRQQNGRKLRLKPVVLAGLMTAALILRTPFAALADTEEARKPGLTVNVVSATDGKVEGAELSVYQIASLDKKNLYRATESFKGLELDFNDLKVKDITALDQFTRDNGIPADRSAVTDQSGSLKMEGLREGIYLVRLTAVDNKKLNVEAAPFLVALPMADEKGGWIYEVTAQPKTVTSTKATDPEKGPTDPTKDPNETTGAPEDPTKDPNETTGDPEDPTKDPNETTGNPENPTKDPNETTGNPEDPTTAPTTAPETAAPGGGGGSHGGGGGNHGGGGSGNPTGPGMETTVIEDNQTPLAGFPVAPTEPDLVLIEDAPVPLAALPQIPKLGDMGASGYLAGLLISLAFGLTAVKKRRDYRTGESD